MNARTRRITAGAATAALVVGGALAIGLASSGGVDRGASAFDTPILEREAPDSRDWESVEPVAMKTTAVVPAIPASIEWDSTPNSGADWGAFAASSHLDW